MRRLIIILSTTVIALVFLLLIVGAAVRTMGAGMACPDWPTCNGYWIPPFDPLVFAEWFHRLMALVVSVLVLAQAVLAGVSRKLRRCLGTFVVFSVGLLILQAALGAITVFQNNSPWSVTVHLLAAAVFFGILIIIREQLITSHSVSPATNGILCELPPPLMEGGQGAGDPGSQGGRKLRMFRRHLWLTLFTVFLQIGIGGWVSSSHAGIVCPDWPTCNGQWFPAMAGPVGLQMTHRFVAYVIVLLVVGTFFMSRKTNFTPRNTRLMRLCLITVLLQLGLGISLVYAKLSMAISVAHLGLAMFLFGLLTALAYGIRRS